jgi:hypothetical protein
MNMKSKASGGVRGRLAIRRWWEPEEGVFRPSGQGVRFHDREAIEALRDALTDVLNLGELDWNKEPESE